MVLMKKTLKLMFSCPMLIMEFSVMSEEKESMSHQGCMTTNKRNAFVLKVLSPTVLFMANLLEMCSSFGAFF